MAADERGIEYAGTAEGAVEITLSRTFVPQSVMQYAQFCQLRADEGLAEYRVRMDERLSDYRRRVESSHLRASYPTADPSPVGEPGAAGSASLALAVGTGLPFRVTCPRMRARLGLNDHDPCEEGNVPPMYRNVPKDHDEGTPRADTADIPPVETLMALVPNFPGPSSKGSPPAPSFDHEETASPQAPKRMPQASKRMPRRGRPARCAVCSKFHCYDHE